MDGFFEWKAVKGEKLRQPFAIAMKDGAPFASARAVGELEGHSASTQLLHRDDTGERVRGIHKIPRSAREYARWLSDEEDPRELLKPYPSEPITMWPVSTRVNSYKNDDPSLMRACIPEAAGAGGRRA